MVLRGQPVGEQGAADRWTALDPHQAGSGAGAPRGIPSRGAPFFLSLSLPVCVRRAPRGLDPGAWLPNFPHIVQPRAPGPFFHAAVHLLNASPVDLLGLRNPWECRVTIVSSFNTFAFVSF